MYQILLTNGTAFKQIDGKSILESAEHAGIQLPYSCRSGRCRACLCAVVEGETGLLVEELARDKDAKDGSEILSCARFAKSDLVLDAKEINLDLPSARTYPAKVDEIVFAGDGDVALVTLRLPPSSEFRFIPGQFLDVFGVADSARSYSIERFDEAKKTVKIHLKRIINGVFSDYIFERARPHDLLRVKGPLGTFFLSDVAGKDLIFLATGTGVSPILAMLRSLRDLDPSLRPRSVLLYWGVRRRTDFYIDVSEFREECEVNLVLSQPDDDWDGRVGHVQDVLTAMHPDVSNARVYACGSPTMIASAVELLTSRGLDSQCFFSDAFVASD